MKNMDTSAGLGSGIDQLLIAAESLGDHPAVQLPESERNNFHGYARSPAEKAYSQSGQKDQARERKSEDRFHNEPKERQRPGGRSEHNRLEKDRRAQLKTNFNNLKDVVPNLKDKKTSNQGILKGSQRYIQGLIHTGKKLEQELQSYAAEKCRLLVVLEKTKEQFELDNGFPAHKYLDTLNGVDMADQDSDSTLSATECTDNLDDFMDDKEPERDQLEEVTRGIPHSVIKPVPQSQGSLQQRINLERSRMLVSSTAATPNTVQKLHAKLTSTKQHDASAVNPPPAVRPVTVTQRPQTPRQMTVTQRPQSATAAVGGSGSRYVGQGQRLLPSSSSSSVVPVAVASGGTLPQVQAAGVGGQVGGQSLLPAHHPPTPFSSALFYNSASGSSPAVLVPTTSLPPTHTQRLNGQVFSQALPLKEVHGYLPQHHHVLVTNGAGQGSWIVMTNPLPTPVANNKPTVAARGVL